MVFAAAAAAASSAVASKSVFEYNREGFMEDREQRMKKEFAERKYRIAQAELWREDVRSFVELTERKMSIYLLVNVLMLGFTLNLWCEGRLPEEETPNWLMMGNQLAIVGAFCFLLLTVWLAMHASVAAQSYQARVLTQMVRLPIPSWDELEACRTYGSDFERLEPRQMFRVPFITGTQEDVLRSTVGDSSYTSELTAGGPGGSETPEPSSASASAASDGRSTGSSSGRGLVVATDPWGLEKRGDDTYELGCQIGSDVAKLRHIKLMRQAAVYWQTYDAFARVSMSIGVNQLMLAMSYYILGYVLTQVQAPIPAFCGVMVLIGTAEVISQIELTLPKMQHRLIQGLLMVGPGISCLAGWHWRNRDDVALRIAECLAPVAFFTHGIVIGLLTMILRVKEQENGAMIPLAFQGVLYLDVFGWVWHKHATPASGGDGIARGGNARGLAAAMRTERRRPSVPRGRSSSIATEESGDISYYAMDYMQETPGMPGGVGKRNSLAPDENEQDLELGGSGKPESVARPALACVLYEAEGRPVPTSPEEMAKEGTVHDLRGIPGAPRMSDEVNAVQPPAKEFWSPVTFMPPESRSRQKMDTFLAEHAENIEGEASEQLGGKGAGEFAKDDGFSFFSDEDSPIATGHDNEMPGVLPWTVFKLAAAITSLAWILGGIYFTLHVNNIWTMELPWFHHHLPILEGTHANVSMLQARHRVVQDNSILELWAAGIAGTQVGPALESINVTWPYATVAPHGLACSPDGLHLLATDGLGTFSAQLRQPSQAATAPAMLSTHFRHLPRCRPLLGRQVEDIAIQCGQIGNGTCEALVLYGHGHQLARCSLGRSESSSADSITTDWLHPARAAAADPRVKQREEATSLLLDPACEGSASRAPGLGCAAVGTTHGRVARLRAHADGSHALVPSSIFEAVGLGSSGKPESTVNGGVRAFSKRYVGVLQPKRRSIRILDSSNDGAEVGVLLLPTTEPIGAFCASNSHIFLLGQGQQPRLWRLPLPEGSLRTVRD